MIKKLALLFGSLGLVVAQRPTNTSICDFYTTALLKSNNATSQYTLLTLLVNTVVIGNYTQPNHNAVPGILAANATFEGKPVNLVPYFSGALQSSNVGGMAAAVNFLDDGGAAPLMANKPANGTSSNQFKLLTHLYSFFGTALGCTTVGMTGFPGYDGKPSMYEVHKFMALNSSEVGYFIQQVGLAAQSFGVAQDDITAVGTLLTDTFDRKCSAPAAVIPSQGAALQAICTQNDCQMATNATCDAYAAAPTSQPAAGTPSATAPAASASGGAGGGGAAAGGGGGSTGAASSNHGTSILVAGIMAVAAILFN